MIIKYISFLIGVMWSYSIIKTQSVFSKKVGLIFKIFITKVSWLTLIAACYFGYKNFSIKFTIIGVILAILLVNIGFYFSKKLPNSKTNELFEPANKAKNILILLTIIIAICFGLIFSTYTTSNNTATWTYPGASVNGCDSVVTLNLLITTQNYSTIDSVGTQCDSYTWIDGNTYYNDTIVDFIIVNSAGCDSTVILDLTINNSTSGTDTQVACGSYTSVSYTHLTLPTNREV